MGKTALAKYLLHTALVLLLALSVAPMPCQAKDVSSTEADNLFELSLEELTKLQVSVPAAITKLTLAETPASITVITADDIRHTPARNIYDLLEVYVPGAMWMNHEEGPHPGIRGSITNRNYKFLLLVNGRLMNSSAHYGAKSELEQWDLSDIQRIEIIRGPGSVTYGPGAVAGVFNIITRNAKVDAGNTFTARYVDKYDSQGMTIRHGHAGKNYKLYSFASITQTKGYAAKQFLVNNNNNADYIGEGAFINDEVLDYYADYQDDPQIKLHLDMDFYEKWRLWIRYTQQGSTWRGNEVKSDFAGQLLNQQSLRDRQLTATVEFKDNLSEKLSLSTMISINSFDAERRGEKVRNPDPDHVENFKANYSEYELFLKNIFNWQASNDVEVGLGFEISRTRYGPGWGDTDQQMRLGDDANVVNGPDSEAIGGGLSPGEAIYAGDGWYTNTYSLFGETNIILNESNKLLVSGRLDKNTYTDSLFSPRLALITEVEKNHLVKVIAQRSQRMNTAGQLYIENLNGVDSKEESLNSLELSYNGTLGGNKKFKVAYFYNDSEVLAWNNNIDTSVFVGDLQLYGLEAEFEYRSSKGMFGINYSFVKQTDWDLADNLTASGVSYSDYNQVLKNTSATMLGFGNDLNNWPNQSIKFFGRINLTNSLTLHADARLYWDYKGSQDGLDSLNQAVQGEPEEAAVEQSIAIVKAKNVYDYDFRFNASLLYKISKKLEVQIYGQNLLGANDNKRYSYDSGNTRASPRRVRFVEEPQTFGFRLDYKF